VDLIYLCTFGLDDPIRPGMNRAIHTIRYGHKDAEPKQDTPSQVNIRMITGDHLETAKAVAVKCGIVK